MGAPVTISHDDIDPSSIKAASFGHEDIDLGSVQEPEESLGQKALSTLGTVGKAVDSVTGAPTRAGIAALQDGKPFWSAVGHQFGNMTDEAPSGKDIAARAGLSTEPSSPRLANTEDSTIGPQSDRMAMMKLGANTSPAGAAGAVIDQAANPLNLTGPILKMVGKVGEAAAPLADSLHSFSTDRALKAAGAMKKDFNIIHAKGTEDALGSFLLDNKIVTPFSTLSTVADRIGEAKETAGQTIGHILDTADAAKAPPISARDIALKLSEDPEIKQLASVPGQEGTSNQINKFIQTLYDHPEGDGLSLRDAQELRQGIDKSINFNKRVPEMAGAQPYLFKMRDAISNAMNDSVNALGSGADVDKLKTANAAYSKLATLDKMAQNRLGALSSNEKLSLSDKIAAGVGAVAGHGNPLTAGALAVANKTARSVGNSMAATGASAASKFLEATPEAVASIPNSAGPAASLINQTVMPSAMPSAASQPQPTPKGVMPMGVPQAPAPQQVAPVDSKGPDKWASDGFHNMKGHVNDQDRQFLEKYKDAMLVDPRAKELLVTASNYAPGSKPLDDVLKHLKNKFGDK